MKDLVAGESGFNFSVVARQFINGVRYCIEIAAEELVVRITSQGCGVAEKGYEFIGAHERCQVKSIAVNPISGNRTMKLIGMTLACMNSIV
jgi:hypothetical protein